MKCQSHMLIFDLAHSNSQQYWHFRYDLFKDVFLEFYYLDIRLQSL
jgi:hypothetical protein